MRPQGVTSRLITVVIVSLAALFSGAVVLTSWYHSERAARARAHVSAARAYAQRDQLPRAVEEYRAALLLERGDREAAHALALTLLELGRVAEAESYLTDLLQQEPVSAPLNLGLARIRSAGGADDEARRLYQRAIYGEWPDGQPEGRVEVRFELARYLLSHGTREDVLSELLRLKAELTPEEIPDERRLANLLLLVDAPDVAADVLAAVVETQPRDVELLSELAEAQAQAGRPADARLTLRRVLAIDPARDQVRERLAVLERVLALDPTLPDLRITTRMRRARQLLDAVVDESAACEQLPLVGDVRRMAQRRLRRRAPSTSDAAEEDLAISAQLWAAAAACRSAGGEAEAVSRVIERVQGSLEDSPR